MTAEETAITSQIMDFWKSDVPERKSNDALVDYATHDLNLLLVIIKRLEEGGTP